MAEANGNVGDSGGKQGIRADPSQGLLQVEDEHRPHRPLTPLRAVRGAFCLLLLLWTALVMLVFLAPICCLLVRLLNRHYSRELVAFFFGHWLAMWPFLFENINETKVVFSGDRLPSAERAVAICNHRTEVDWMYIWNLALRKGRIGYVKYIVKNSVRNVPVFGWALYAMEFLLIERKWEVDEPHFDRYVESFEDTSDPLWLILFPEGTDYTEKKKISSQEYAEQNGLKKLDHVLLPRTRGFFSCISRLHHSIDAVYDLTIAYKHRCPLFVHNLFGTDPSEVHIHIKRVPMEEMPLSETECSNWLYASYETKDQLLAFFQMKGYFPNCGIESGLQTGHFMINFLGIVLVTSLLTYMTFFTSIWLKLYFAVSCVYLSLATYFDWRPSGHTSRPKNQ